MTNTLAILLGLLIIGLVTADMVWRDGADLVYLGRKLIELSNYMAFWR